MRERATWRIWIVLVVTVALQTTLLARFRPLGVAVDWALMTTVSVAILLGWPVGAMYGLAAGLLCGWFSGFHPGSWAFSRLVVGASFGGFDRRFSTDNPLAAPMCVAGATVMANALFMLMSPADFPLRWWVVNTAWQMVGHAVLIVPLHAVLDRFVLPPSRLMFGGDQHLSKVL